MSKRPVDTKSRVSRTSKIHPVPLKLMRVPPALVTQRPFRKAWGEELAGHLELEKLGYPIVNHRGGVFWVLDGQHRLYALKQNGFADEVLDCEVYEGLTDAEMASIFLGRDDRKAINAFDKFHIACTAEYQSETDIRRSVEAQGLKISRVREEKAIGAVAALRKVYDRAGVHVLEQSLRTLRDGFGGDPLAFDGSMIEGVGLLFQRYNGQTNERALAQKLSAQANGVRGVIRRAEAQREKTGNGKAQCVAAVVVDIYNKGTASHAQRLAPWWKSTDK